MNVTCSVKVYFVFRICNFKSMSLELFCAKKILHTIHTPAINTQLHDCPSGQKITFCEFTDSYEKDCYHIECLLIPEFLKKKLQCHRKFSLLAYNKFDLLAANVPNSLITRFMGTEPFTTFGYWQMNENYSYCNCRIWRGSFGGIVENGVGYHTFELML